MVIVDLITAGSGILDDIGLIAVNRSFGYSVDDFLTAIILWQISKGISPVGTYGSTGWCSDYGISSVDYCTVGQFTGQMDLNGFRTEAFSIVVILPDLGYRNID